VAERDNRKEERVPAAWRVDLDSGGVGTTRDVSASGIFFEGDASYACGTSIEFSIDINTPGGPMILRCRGEVVRVERRDTKVGVAVRILDSMLNAASAPLGEFKMAQS
jgi:hypothetical protein